MPPGSDRMILIAEPNAELLLGLVLLAIGLGGGAFTAMVVARDRDRTWWPGAPFGLLVLCASVILAYVPSRLELDPNGINAALGPFRRHWAWASISALEVSQGMLGMWISFAEAGADASASPTGRRRIAYYLGALAVEPRMVERRARAWQLSPGR